MFEPLLSVAPLVAIATAMGTAAAMAFALVLRTAEPVRDSLLRRAAARRVLVTVIEHLRSLRSVSPDAAQRVLTLMLSDPVLAYWIIANDDESLSLHRNDVFVRIPVDLHLVALGASDAVPTTLSGVRERTRRLGSAETAA